MIIKLKGFEVNSLEFKEDLTITEMVLKIMETLKLEGGTNFSISGFKNKELIILEPLKYQNAKLKEFKNITIEMDYLPSKLELKELEELINKHFPKGECKERGKALMVFAEYSIWLKKFKHVK